MVALRSARSSCVRYLQALDHTSPKVAPELRLYFRRSTTQALYFANSAAALARARADGDGGGAARALLSGMFALMFCLSEVGLKLLAGLVLC